MCTRRVWREGLISADSQRGQRKRGAVTRVFQIAGWSLRGMLASFWESHETQNVLKCEGRRNTSHDLRLQMTSFSGHLTDGRPFAIADVNRLLVESLL